MKHILYLIIILIAAIYFWPENDPGKKIRELSEPPEIYFNPKEKYEVEEPDANVSVTLRKANTTFQIPRNSLVGVYHPYKPWAKEIWDSFSYWVTWPKFKGRNKDNIQIFTNYKSPKIIKVYVSAFGLELESDNFFHESFKKMGMEKIRSIEQPVNNLVRLISPSKNNNEFPSYYYQAQKDYLTFPSGLPLQIKCAVKYFWDPEKRTRPCSVEFILPIQAWPEQYRYPLGGGHSQCSYGIKVRYTFHENLINDWEAIFNNILSDVVSKISYPEIAYNKQLQRINFSCAKIAR